VLEKLVVAMFMETGVMFLTTLVRFLTKLSWPPIRNSASSTDWLGSNFPGSGAFNFWKLE
jgi:hypothetical protein